MTIFAPFKHELIIKPFKKNYAAANTKNNAFNIQISHNRRSNAFVCVDFALLLHHAAPANVETSPIACRSDPMLKRERTVNTEATDFTETETETQ